MSLWYNTEVNSSKHSWVVLFLVLTFLSVACKNDYDPDFQHQTWRDYGGGPDQSKFVKLDDIQKSNVDQLEVAWFYSTEDENVYQFNPVIVDTVMYVLAKNNSLVAIDARTGEEIWIHAHLRGMARRGINYWESENGQDKRLIFQMNDYLQAIDAETGESIEDFGENGLVDLRQNLPPRDPATINRAQSGTPGKIFENLIILGSAPGEAYLSAPGHIRAYDVRTGELAWIFHTVPQPGEYGYETWPEDAYKYIGGINTWAEISVDEERGIAYFPLGSPSYDFYGADRIGQNLFGNSILALDAQTGERLWYYQLIHHDLWDYDPAAAPQLVTVNHDGEEIDAVAVATKHGFLFAFNRVTGEPLWPIEERPVPESHVPGEEAWPTQPFPTHLPPFSRQSMTVDDISPYIISDDERAEWEDKIRELEELGRTGLFTPLSHEHETLTVPGAVGGANWGNTAANPDKGLVYVISIDWPSLYPPLEQREFLPENQNDDDSGGWVNPVIRGGNVYQAQCQVCHAADRSGIGGIPTLVDMEMRLSYTDFQQVVRAGRGEMPAFTHLTEQEVEGLYQYLGGSRDGEIVTLPEGPVVANGGITGSQDFRPADRPGGRLGPPYPDDVDAPDVRYYLDGWGLGYAHIISPPWATLTAYDLNEGTIKWERPLGVDKLAAQEGGENTGAIKAQRNGMIITSTDLVFATAGDGKIRAFDADDGEELWIGELPTGTEGLPAMYEINGKSYLVVTTTTPIVWGDGVREVDVEAGDIRPQGGYMVFTLPE